MPSADNDRPRPHLPAAGQEGKQAALVAAMFDRVAPRYDLANTVLSFGQDAGWREVAARAAAPSGATVLDVAAGTGRLGDALLAHGAARVVALDLSWQMLATGATRSGNLRWVNGDGLRLPFAAATFDAVTIGFGLRNLPDARAGLIELARVTKPGGRLVVLEFSTPTWGPFREFYRRWLVGALPRIAGAVSPSPDAYRYLADSILAWPDADALSRWIADAGWGDVAYRRLTGGVVAVHRASRT